MSATDANRHCIRYARMVTGRSKIIVIDRCYHGSVDETFATLDAQGKVILQSNQNHIYIHAFVRQKDEIVSHRSKLWKCRQYLVKSKGQTWSTSIKFKWAENVSSILQGKCEYYVNVRILQIFNRVRLTEEANLCSCQSDRMLLVNVVAMWGTFDHPSIYVIHQLSYFLPEP